MINKLLDEYIGVHSCFRYDISPFANLFVNLQKFLTPMPELSKLALLREREDHIEFKEAKHNYPFAGGSHSDVKERRKCVLGYIVAFANERGGRLVLGMADKMPHEVVGTDFAKDKVGQLEDEIYRRFYIRVHC